MRDGTSVQIILISLHPAFNTIIEAQGMVTAPASPHELPNANGVLVGCSILPPRQEVGVITTTEDGQTSLLPLSCDR